MTSGAGLHTSYLREHAVSEAISALCRPVNFPCQLIDVLRASCRVRLFWAALFECEKGPPPNSAGNRLSMISVRSPIGKFRPSLVNFS